MSGSDLGYNATRETYEKRAIQAAKECRSSISPTTAAKKCWKKKKERKKGGHWAALSCDDDFFVSIPLHSFQLWGMAWPEIKERHLIVFQYQTHTQPGGRWITCTLLKFHGFDVLPNGLSSSCADSGTFGKPLSLPDPFRLWLSSWPVFGPG